MATVGRGWQARTSDRATPRGFLYFMAGSIDHAAHGRADRLAFSEICKGSGRVPRARAGVVDVIVRRHLEPSSFPQHVPQRYRLPDDLTLRKPLRSAGLACRDRKRGTKKCLEYLASVKAHVSYSNRRHSDS